MVENILNSIGHFHPEIAMVVTLCVVIIADLLLKREDHTISWIFMAGLAVTGFLVLRQSGTNTSIFEGMVAVDPFAVFFKVVLILAAVFIVLFTVKSRELDPYKPRMGEYYMLISGMMLGMMIMVGSANLLIMYLALELTSISSYVLAGFTKKMLKSAEASVKYIMYGAVSSGIMLYGLSLLIGITGATDIYAMNAALAAGIEQPVILYVSILMILVGLGFKIAVVPFHFWAPDVYEGAPITITAFLAVASKIAALAMMIRLFKVSFTDTTIAATMGQWPVFEGLTWPLIVGVMAALAMIVGNLTALRQDNIKRMLAYSSIAHAGYILMGFVVLTNEGISAIMIYVIMYLFMNLGAFYVAMLFSNAAQTESIEKYKGLGFRAPLECIAMTIFLIALVGLPPTAGFIAKLYIFGAAVSAGWIWLVFIAGVTTVISLFYYIRVVRNMFFFKSDGISEPLVFDAGSKVILLLLLIPVLLFGVYFSPVIEFARTSLAIFGM